jgi:Tol biopolymer transport system component
MPVRSFRSVGHRAAQRRHRFLITMALLAVLGTVTAMPSSAVASFPGKDGLIAFTRIVKNHKTAIVIVRPNGEKVRTIRSQCCNAAWDPTWSANGRRIAFSGSQTHPPTDLPRDGNIFTMNKKGKGLERLTSGTLYNGRRFKDRYPSWSPDGTQLVFAREYPVVGSGQQPFVPPELFVVNADGSGLHTLETPPLMEGVSNPTWSPDGEWIAFEGGAPFGLYRVRPDGSDMQLVTDFSLPAWPDWSPDGELITFAETSGRSTSLYTVRPDGTGLTKVTKKGSQAYGEPAFSPEGDRIVFVDKGILKLIPVEGGKGKPLLKRNREFRDFTPSWRPG